MRPKREPAVGHPPAPSSSTHDDRRQLSRYYYYCPRAFEGKPSKQTKYSLSPFFCCSARSCQNRAIPTLCTCVHVFFTIQELNLCVIVCYLCSRSVSNCNSFTRKEGRILSHIVHTSIHLSKLFLRLSFRRNTASLLF